MIDPSTRADLLARGLTVRQIAAAVHAGTLIRARRGRYLPPAAAPELVSAVRVGGRLACVDELRARGIWTLGDGRLHVHVPGNAARLRDPVDRAARLGEAARVRCHWEQLADPAGASSGHVSAADALLQAARCLPRRSLQASLDSAARQGRMRRSLLERDPIVGPLLDRVDTSADSGLETIVRELVRNLGFAYATQVAIDGAGFVDLLVEGWVAIECDGLGFHVGPAVSRDRRRDAAVAATGRTMLRFGYGQIVHDLPAVAWAVVAAVGAHRRVANAGAKARRAVRRLQNGLIS